MGVLMAVLVGIVIGLFFALFVVKLKSDEFIIGMALNTFAAGLTVYLLRSIFGVKGTFSNSDIVALPTIHMDFLDNIPVLGPLLNDNSLFVYLTWLLVFLTWVFFSPHPVVAKTVPTIKTPANVIANNFFIFSPFLF